MDKKIGKSHVQHTGILDYLMLRYLRILLQFVSIER